MPNSGSFLFIVLRFQPFWFKRRTGEEIIEKDNFTKSVSDNIAPLEPSTFLNNNQMRYTGQTLVFRISVW
jgi:hypothetical protein